MPEDQNSMSFDGFLSEVSSIKNRDELKGNEPAGWKLGPSFNILEEDLNGNWKEECFIAIGGRANHGKSALISQLGLAIAQYNPEALVIFHTIDDSKEQQVTRLVTQLAAQRAQELEMEPIVINMVRHPNYWADRADPEKAGQISSLRNWGYSKLTQLIQEHKVIVRGIDNGITVNYAESLIRFISKKNPDKKLVYVLDNFHKLKDTSGQRDERLKFKYLSNFIKNDICVKYRMSAICTMEYPKIAPLTKPSNSNLKETGDMEYDTNVIIHVYNELADRQQIGQEDNTVYYWGSELNKKPLVELIIGKNKVTESKGSRWLKFAPETGTFSSIPEVEAKAVGQSHGGERQTTWKGGYKVEIPNGPPEVSEEAFI